jgi:hypothetical protein
MKKYEVHGWVIWTVLIANAITIIAQVFKLIEGH